MDNRIDAHRPGSGMALLNPWRVAGWALAATLLALPAVAMRFTKEVNWTGSDFVAMGVLLGTVGLSIELLVRQSGKATYRLGAVLAVLAAFLTIWVNLAVGVVGSENRSYNLLFFGVVVLAAAGAAIVRCRAAGMARVMLLAAVSQVLAAAGGYASDPRGAVFGAILALPWLLSALLFRSAAGRA